jgi:hypothetical protein
MTSRIEKRPDGRCVLSLAGTNDAIYSFFVTSEDLTNLKRQIEEVISDQHCIDHV